MTDLEVELAGALKSLLRATDALMPGLAHIAVQDYAIINDAPLAAARVLAKYEAAWTGEDDTRSTAPRETDASRAARLARGHFG